mmetsp:Transcript_4094/g.12716  ORF Transcript_4094/g.12716 Transcript_4094/m.12716 type:complete len:328 (-) Transcript_4094:432-1415(-)
MRTGRWALPRHRSSSRHAAARSPLPRSTRAVACCCARSSPRSPPSRRCCRSSPRATTRCAGRCASPTAGSQKRSAPSSPPSSPSFAASSRSSSAQTSRSSGCTARLGTTWRYSLNRWSCVRRADLMASATSSSTFPTRSLCTTLSRVTHGSSRTNSPSTSCRQPRSRARQRRRCMCRARRPRRETTRPASSPRSSSAPRTSFASATCSRSCCRSGSRTSAMRSRRTSSGRCACATRRRTALRSTWATPSSSLAPRPRCSSASSRTPLGCASRHAQSLAQSGVAPTRSRTRKTSRRSCRTQRRSRSLPCAPTSTATTNRASARPAPSA